MSSCEKHKITKVPEKALSRSSYHRYFTDKPQNHGRPKGIPVPYKADPSHTLTIFKSIDVSSWVEPRFPWMKLGAAILLLITGIICAMSWIDYVGDPNLAGGVLWQFKDFLFSLFS